MWLYDLRNCIQGYGRSVSPLGVGDDPYMEDGLISREVHYHRRMAVKTSSGPRYVGKVRITNKRGGDDGYAPEYTTRANMVKSSKAKWDRYGYKSRVNDKLPTTTGYTLSNLTIRFANLKDQWRRTRNAFVFTRGDIFLDLEITIYVTDEARKKPQCSKLIMKHEMMHVDHETTIVTQTMPGKLPTLPLISSEFTKPIHAEYFDRKIRGDGEGRGSELERTIQRIWVGLSSKKANELHSAHPKHGANISDCLGTSKGFR